MTIAVIAVTIAVTIAVIAVTIAVIAVTIAVIAVTLRNYSALFSPILTRKDPKNYHNWPGNKKINFYKTRNVYRFGRLLIVLFGIGYGWIVILAIGGGLNDDDVLTRDIVHLLGTPAFHT